MLNISAILLLVGTTSSYSDKQYILKKTTNEPGLKEILRFIYNPYNKTGISALKLARALNSRIIVDPITYTEAIEYFTKHTTGTDADLLVAAKFIKHTMDIHGKDHHAVNIAKALITQDLQIGVSYKTLNAVYGDDFIPVIGCMLGTRASGIDNSKIKWPCIVTEKIDGVRRIMIKENGICKLYSRSGHEDVGLVEIIEDAKHLPDNRVYDGELKAIGTFKDCVALRQATNSLANLKGTKRGLTFNIFDMMPSVEYFRGYSDDPAIHRKLLLGATLMDDSVSLLGFDDWPKYIASYGIHKNLNFIKSVPILGLAKCMAEVDPIVAEFWARGDEGVMLNTSEGIYEVKRSKQLLKVKHVKEYTLTVVDMIEGAGKFENTLGSLVVEYKGNKLGVGSGFTDDQRSAIWASPECIIGKQIEIDSFGESTNKQGTISLNCPIFKRFVGGVE